MSEAENNSDISSAAAMADSSADQVQYDDEPTIEQVEPSSADAEYPVENGDSVARTVFIDDETKTDAVANEDTVMMCPAESTSGGTTKTVREQYKDEDDDERCSTLYIRNLPLDFRSEDVRNDFSRFGEIIDSRVVINPVTKDSRGFGFVSFRTVQMADEAMEKMDGVELQGKQLRIEKAKRNRPHDPTPGEYKGPTGASIKYDNRGRLKPGYVPYWDLPYPKSSFRGKPSVFSPDRRRMSRRSSSRELFRDGGRMSSPGYERDRYAPMDSRPPPSGGWSPRERKSVGYYGGPVDRAMPYEVHYRRPELDSRPLASSSRYPTDYDDRGRYESRSGRRPSPYPIRPRSRSPLPRAYTRRSQSPPVVIPPQRHAEEAAYTRPSARQPYDSHYRGSSSARHYSPRGFPSYTKPSVHGRYPPPSVHAAPKNIDKYPPAYRGGSRERYTASGPTSDISRPYGQPPRGSRDDRPTSRHSVSSRPSGGVGSGRIGGYSGGMPIVRRPSVPSVEETQSRYSRR